MKQYFLFTVILFLSFTSTVFASEQKPGRALETESRIQLNEDTGQWEIVGPKSAVQDDDLPSYITRVNCSVPPLDDLLLAPYLINRWIDNRCIIPAELEKVVAPIVKAFPAQQIDDNINGYDLLSRLAPSNEKYREKLKYYEKRKKISSEVKKRRKIEKAREKQEKIEKVREEMRESGYVLELDTWKWEVYHGYAKATGLVRNISGDRLIGLEAVVLWFTKGGDFITSSTALIEYTTLMPGQASPFEVIEPANPLMNSAQLAFKNRSGVKVPMYKKQR